MKCFKIGEELNSLRYIFVVEDYIIVKKRGGFIRFDIEGCLLYIVE